MWGYGEVVNIHDNLRKATLLLIYHEKQYFLKKSSGKLRHPQNVLSLHGSMQKYYLNVRILPELTEIEWLPCGRNTKLNQFEQCALQEKLALGNREYCQLCRDIAYCQLALCDITSYELIQLLTSILEISNSYWTVQLNPSPNQINDIMILNWLKLGRNCHEYTPYCSRYHSDTIASGCCKLLSIK